MMTGQKRYRRTMAMALRFAWQLWWLRQMGRVRSAKTQATKRSALYTRQAHEFVSAATALGGLFIKIGQYIATQVDIIPLEYTRILGTLQDQVTPFDSNSAQLVIESELGRPIGEIFPRFDAVPVAAASIAQVHQAWLPDGSHVAVKVQRPNIEELIRIDLRSLKRILSLIDRWTTFGRHISLDALHTEMAETFLAETDFDAEGLNAERFQINFLENPQIDIPQIYWNQSSRRILTMEYMDGIKINDLTSLDAAGINRQLLARILLDCYLQMILKDGLLHADPHPGNIFIRHDGVVQLLDFGMVVPIAEDLREGFADFALAFVQKDFERCADILVRLGFLSSQADTRIIAEAFEPLVATTMAGSWRTGGELSPQMLEDLQQFIFDGGFFFPNNITFLGKGLITVIGVCIELEPNLDLVAEVRDLAQNYVNTQQFSEILHHMKDDASHILRSLLPAARANMEMVVKANSGRLQVRLDPFQERRLVAVQDRSARRIAGSVLGACLFGAGVATVIATSMTVVGAILGVTGLAMMMYQWLRH